ncbi:HET-domain-containing protein, partial [Lojkania enalia]
YLALSYVWGGANTFHLTKSNFEVLRQPGSLMEYFPHIPQVVRDAMRFTDQLNVQYLWCDSLCIIQDDPIHRDPQITHMNTVYRHAFATVVAMSGQSADDRLPGLSLGSRSSLQPIRLHRGVDLEPLPPSLELAMLSSQYESRAWTYQERILSARCLYFTHSQLYFQCRSSLRSENGESIHYVKRHLVNPLLEFETRPHTALDYFWLDFFRCYDLVVRTYTQRHLSHQYDKLRAFSGISTMFEESRAGAFQYGLPEAVLDLVLLWIPCGQITRVSSKKYDPSSCRDYIPSWSWAGWDGPV